MSRSELDAAAAGLRSATPAIRIESCRALFKAESITDEIARVLVDLFEHDEEWIDEWFVDGAGETVPGTMSVREVALVVLEKHGPNHFAVIRDALQSAAPSLRAQLVRCAPTTEPWEFLIGLTRDPDPAVRRVAFRHLADASHHLESRYPSTGGPPVIEREASERGRPLYVTRFLGVLDSDREIARDAALTAPVTVDQSEFQKAADHIAREMPEAIERMCAQLDDPHDMRASAAATMLGWFRRRTDVADALASIIVRKPKTIVAIEASSSLLRVGPVMGDAASRDLTAAIERGEIVWLQESLVRALANYGARAAFVAPAILQHRAQDFPLHNISDFRSKTELDFLASVGALAQDDATVRESLVRTIRERTDLLAGMAAVAVAVMKAHLDQILPVYEDVLRAPFSERTAGILAATTLLPKREAIEFLPRIVGVFERWLAGEDAPTGIRSAIAMDVCRAIAARGRDALSFAPLLVRSIGTDVSAAYAAIDALRAMKPLPIELRREVAALDPRPSEPMLRDLERLFAS